MKRVFLHIAAVILLITSCVSPGEIEIFRDKTWAVFGLVGEDKAPVIFVYALSDYGGYVYDPGAEIIFTDKSSGVETALVPVIATDEAFVGTREYPFDQDGTGNVYYFTTPLQMPLASGDYKVSIKTGEQVGVSDISFPEKEPFTNVEIRNNGNGVSRLYMEVEETDEHQLIKWEVAIDQQIDIMTPVAFDSITGDPIDFETISFPFTAEILPNNYLSHDKVIEEEGVFTYKLTDNLPNYENNQDPYFLNVRLRNYSAALVEYFESVSRQVDGSVFDPFVEPNVIKSNIEGIYGVIGTYSYSEDLILEYQP